MIAIDGDLKTTKEEADDEIIDCINNITWRNENDMGDEIPKWPHSVKESRAPLVTLRGTLGFRYASEEIYGMFYDLERDIRNLIKYSVH